MTTPAKRKVIAPAPSEGWVDSIRDGRIYGWAWSTGEPELRLALDVFYDDELLDTVTADRFREDLKGNDIGDGRHAFVFDLPAELRSTRTADFTVCFHDTKVALEPGPRMISAPEGGDLREMAPAGLAALHHRVDRLEATAVKLFNLLSALDHKIESGNVAGEGTGSSELPDSLDHLARRFDAVEARVEDADRSITCMDGFLLRYDERLRGCADADRVSALERRMARKHGWLPQVAIAVAAAILALTLTHLQNGLDPGFTALFD